MNGRSASLTQETLSLTQNRDALSEELKRLEKIREGLDASIRQTKTENAPIALPGPYPVMVFDIDNTLTDVTSEINQDLLQVLLGFLNDGVRIALVTAQSFEEVKRYVIKLVPRTIKRVRKRR